MCRIYWLILILFFVCSCTKRIYIPQETIVTNTEKVIETRDTLIYVEIPKEVQTVISDSSSYLENTYAKSKAFLLDGKLYHSLESQDTIPVKTKNYIRTITHTIKKSVPYPVITEKKVIPSWCYILMILNIVILLLYLLKIIRGSK